MTLAPVTTTTTLQRAGLADDVVAKLRAIHDAGTAANTRDAHAADLAYIAAWADLRLENGLEWPMRVEDVLAFVADHVVGLPEDVDAALVSSGAKRQPGPHALNTVRRRVSTLSKAHEQLFASWPEDQRAGAVNPCRVFAVRESLSKAARAHAKNGQKARKVEPILRDHLEAMLETCGDSLLDRRDAALLAVGWASGGRRRSELCALRVEDLQTEPGRGYRFQLAKSKTDQRGERGRWLPVFDRAAVELDRWLEASGLTSGPLFRGVDRLGRLLPVLPDGRGLNGRTVADIVKRRARAAGFGAWRQFSGHSLRRGFATHAKRAGCSDVEIAQLGDWSPGSVAMRGYFAEAELLENRAAALL